jgi:hypothetical protein
MPSTKPTANATRISARWIMEALKASGKILMLTPNQAIDYLRKQLAIAPIDHFITLGLPGGYPFEKFAEHAELFAREVIPAFR